MSTSTVRELAGFIASNCIIMHFDKDILILCKDENDYAFLVKQNKNLSQSLNLIPLDFISPINILEIEKITLVIAKTQIKLSFPINKKMPDNNTKIIIPQAQDDAMIECLSYDGACGIVRMADHKGLFSNEKIIISSKAHPNDWVGKNMADYWIKPELDTYIFRLLREGELRNYSYVAKLMNGENARLTVNARLIEWRGDLVRIVKTLSTEILT